MLHLSSRNQTLILFYLQIKSDSFVWEWKEFGTSKKLTHSLPVDRIIPSADQDSRKQISSIRSQKIC